MCVNRLNGEVRTKVMFKFGPNDLNDCASVEGRLREAVWPRFNPPAALGYTAIVSH